MLILILFIVAAVLFAVDLVRSGSLVSAGLACVAAALAMLHGLP